MKPKALALMETSSFCGGVRHKRYSREQEIASGNSNLYPEASGPNSKKKQIFVEFLARISPCVEMTKLWLLCVFRD